MRQQLNKFHHFLLGVILLVAWLPGHAQHPDTISLAYCYQLLETNYPFIKQRALIAQTGDQQQAMIRKGYRPSVDLAAQATLQSEVTHVPISLPGVEIQAPNKDQYKGTVTINQLLYDGGRLHAAAQLQEVSTAVEQQQLEVSLYQLKARVNDWYFGMLLTQEKKRLLEEVLKNLESRYQEAKSAVANGAALPTADDIIYAELLHVKQQWLEAEADQRAALVMLSRFLQVIWPDGAVLQEPQFTWPVADTLSRPELALYALQRRQWDAMATKTSRQNKPLLSLFVQGGVGNPGLNMLDNTFQPFYYTGARLSWSLWDWHATRDEQQIHLLKKRMTDYQEEVFQLNTDISLMQLQAEIQKATLLIETDETLIALRTDIIQTARAQLSHGVITPSEYITELTKWQEAAITQKTHELQRLKAQAAYHLTLGTLQ